MIWLISLTGNILLFWQNFINKRNSKLMHMAFSLWAICLIHGHVYGVHICMNDEYVFTYVCIVFLLMWFNHMNHSISIGFCLWAYGPMSQHMPMVGEAWQAATEEKKEKHQCRYTFIHAIHERLQKILAYRDDISLQFSQVHFWFVLFTHTRERLDWRIVLYPMNFMNNGQELIRYEEDWWHGRSGEHCHNYHILLVFLMICVLQSCRWITWIRRMVSMFTQSMGRWDTMELLEKLLSAPRRPLWLCILLTDSNTVRGWLTF